MAHKKVAWVRAAADELEEVFKIVAADSEKNAVDVVKAIVDATRDLARFPRMGRRVPEWDDDVIRERIVHRYRVIYRVHPERVTVLSITHGARVLPREIKNRGK